MQGSSPCLEVVQRRFEVLQAESKELGLRALLGAPRGESLEAELEALYRELTARGCYPILARRPEGLVLYVRVGASGDRRWLLAGGLAAATLFTVYVSGLGFERLGEGFAWSSIGYLLGLLLPLVVHELGHWLVMRRYGVPASLPYLIPAPPLQLSFLGTFGAVINMRWLPPSNGSLALMAVAGPLAGFIAALPLAILGIRASVAVSAAEAEALGAVPFPFTPLIVALLGSLVGPQGGDTVILSPLAFASTVVFIVTFLNLIPVAMLDGGHIVRSLLGERGHSAVSAGSVALILAASILVPALTLFAVIAVLLYLMSGGRHPGPVFLREDADWRTKLAAALFAALLVLTLPVPA